MCGGPEPLVLAFGPIGLDLGPVSLVFSPIACAGLLQVAHHALSDGCCIPALHMTGSGDIDLMGMESDVQMLGDGLQG